jgi:nicotinamidase-related amidase
MLTIDPNKSLLLVIDFQARLMPSIDAAEIVVRNARRLLDMASLIEIPIVFTEENPKGLGPTVDALATGRGRVLHKMAFDAVREPGFLDLMPRDCHIVVVGCEAHVCVAQTVLGLIEAGRKVYLVSDAVGSRRPEDKAAAICRLEQHGAEIVTTEMVLFEWLGTAAHPRFREALALIK